MKVLVTGASGMVGRNLVGYLKEKGVEAIPTDLSGWDVSGNILDNDFVFKTLAGLDFDAIVHLAAITEIKKTIEDPRLCFDVNCFGTLNMLELAKRKEVGRIVIACHDSATRVFTSKGLKRYYELEIGADVFTLNRNGIIEPRPIRQIHVYPYDGKMIHFDGKRIDMLVTPNHKMLVRVPRRRGGTLHWDEKFEDAAEVAKHAVSRLSTGRWVGTNPDWYTSDLGLANLRDLFYLTGLYIGDGNLNGRQFQTVETGLTKSQLLGTRDSGGRFIQQPKSPVKREYFYPRIFFAIPRSDKCRKTLESILTRNGVRWFGYDKCVYVNSDFLYKFFGRCSDLEDPRRPVYSKRIPRWMLTAAPEYLEALLEGILDSDGSRGRIVSTVSIQLTEDLMELCAKLGLFTSCYPHKTVLGLDGRVTEFDGFQVSISRKAGTPMFGRRYGNVRYEYYSGNVFCLEVENQNFLVERNGKVGFSGNSSANVFGAPKSNPVTEESPFDPRAPYDYSKVVCENMAVAFYKSNNLPVSVTRSWLLFGEHDQPTRATIRFIRACLKDEPLSLYNSGKDTTSPTHAVNYARLTLEILRNDKAVGQAFNFGGERPVSIRELAETVKKLTRSKSELNLLPPRSELEKDPQISYPSTAKAKTLLGYVPELTLEQGLKRTIEWVKKQA